MASSGRVYGNSNDVVTHMLQNDGFPSSHQSLDSLLFSGTSPTSHGSRSMVNFANVIHGGSMSMGESSFFRSFDQEENCDEDFDEYLRQPEKKRRLTVDQVQFLEKSFEVENKLEPERKVKLAKDLGLQPRQVAIWFQNRRARWKTKQLEKDYDALRASYNTLKANYERMLKEKDKLKTEVLTLTNHPSLKEKEKDKEKESSSELPMPNSNSVISEEEKPLNAVSMVVCKQEDLSSVNSDDVVDSSSPRYNEGVQSSVSVVEAASSSHAFELDQHSELSQDDQEDNFSPNLQQVPSSLYNFMKFEDSVYTNPHANSCNYEFLAEEQPGWFWPY